MLFKIIQIEKNLKFKKFVSLSDQCKKNEAEK